MVSNTTVCLSGTDPIILGANSCNQGFYCPNNTEENPPQYCAPTPNCLIQRLQLAYNICDEPQGIYEPIVCVAGYYCPPGGKEQIICPKDHYCPLGSVKPLKCSLLSVCPKGSVRELHTAGFLCCGLFDLFLLCLWLWPFIRKRLSVKSQNGETLEMQPIPSEDKKTHGLSSIFLNEGSDIVGLGIKFNSIGYRIKSGKSIISEISGSAHDASLLGIMGPSGSGKSTLVNILSGKLHATAGSISLQGVETSLSDKFKDLIGYVPQDDVVHPHLTVRENILFSARIRLGGILKEREIHQNVDQLILALGLTNVKDSLVGDQEQRGVSGGERKRVSIGVELIAAPRMLILDEPTSGLDAQAALSVIMLLKSLSQYGITVICVLHQPRVEIFKCLDTLLLLVSGKQAYFGKRSESQKYFEDRGYDFDPQLNPADVMLDIVSSPLPEFPTPADNVINGTGPKCSAEISQNSLVPSKTTEISQNSSVPRKTNSFTFEKLEALHTLHRTRISPWYRQLHFCFSRDIKQQSRNKGSFLLELFASVLTGILLGMSMYEFKGQLYQGMYLPPFQLLSSAANSVASLPAPQK
ncbi:hypothetical protein O988_08749 [Pseudogymnoascus sp. VKM F-3808]|nr:hypothetical protein O988_08749 [Pseudogymnoascus sp. VKM F-3808]